MTTGWLLRTAQKNVRAGNKIKFIKPMTFSVVEAGAKDEPFNYTFNPGDSREVVSVEGSSLLYVDPSNGQGLSMIGLDEIYDQGEEGVNFEVVSSKEEADDSGLTPEDVVHMQEEEEEERLGDQNDPRPHFASGWLVKAEDIPTEEEQQVQQDVHEIGETKMWTLGQVSVITQKPIEEVSQLEGKVFKYSGGVFEVGKVEGEEVAIKRIASEMTAEYPLTGDPQASHPFDVFETPVSETTGYQIGHIRVSPRTGPLDIRIQKPGKQKGAEVVEKVQVLGPELKSPHVPVIRNPQFNEPSRNDRRFSSIPSPEVVASKIEIRFANCMRPVRVLAMQGIDVRAQLEANYGQFENSVIEDFRGLYPEMVDRLIHGYAEVKNQYVKAFNPSLNPVKTRG